MRSVPAGRLEARPIRRARTAGVRENTAVQPRRRIRRNSSRSTTAPQVTARTGVDATAPHQANLAGRSGATRRSSSRDASPAAGRNAPPGRPLAPVEPAGRRANPAPHAASAATQSQESQKMNWRPRCDPTSRSAAGRRLWQRPVGEISLSLNEARQMTHLWKSLLLAGVAAGRVGSAGIRRGGRPNPAAQRAVHAHRRPAMGRHRPGRQQVPENAQHRPARARRASISRTPSAPPRSARPAAPASSAACTPTPTAW